MERERRERERERERVRRPDFVNGRVYLRALARTRGAYIDHAVVTGQHRASRPFLDLADRENHYPEGISTGVALRARGKRRRRCRRRLQRALEAQIFLIQRVYRRALACCHAADVDHAADAGHRRFGGPWRLRNFLSRGYIGGDGLHARGER